MRKVTRKLNNQESVRLLATYLYDHIDGGGPMPVKVTIERWTNKRSMGQNALFHVWCSDIASEIGDSPNAVKDDLKAMFAEAVIGPLGKARPMNTSEMNTVQMMDFMTAIQVKGAEMGWDLTNAA